MKRSIVLLVCLLALVCAGSLWASGGGGETSEAGKQMTLRGTKWQSFIEEKTMFEDWSGRYAKAHPNVKIQFEMITTGYGDKIIASFAARGRIAAGMASEGYNGGYRDALNDVLLVLSGVRPNRNGWWDEV